MYLLEQMSYGGVWLEKSPQWHIWHSLLYRQLPEQVLFFYCIC